MGKSPPDHPPVMPLSPGDTGIAYDLIADHWDSGALDRNNGIAQHRRAIEFTGNRRSALDVGCGSSGRLIDLLLDSGFDVEGIDVSGKMLKLAKKRHPRVTFHHADICEWEIPGTYDFVTAWDSIWHVPLTEHEKVLRKLFASLSSGGVCIFSAGGLDTNNEKTDASMGPLVYYSTLGIPKILDVISASGCICRHLEYDQYPQQHTCIIVQKQAS